MDYTTVTILQRIDETPSDQQRSPTGLSTPTKDVLRGDGHTGSSLTNTSTQSDDCSTAPHQATYIPCSPSAGHVITAQPTNQFSVKDAGKDHNTDNKDSTSILAYYSENKTKEAQSKRRERRRVQLRNFELCGYICGSVSDCFDDHCCQCWHSYTKVCKGCMELWVCRKCSKALCTACESL